VLDMDEFAQIAFSKSLWNSEAICFDLGTNVRLYTLLLARYCQYVYTFESVPRNVMYLQQSILKNHLVNVTVIHVAIGEQLSLVRFAGGENYAIGRLSEEGEQTVVVISCDAFVETYGIEPDIIKVDVEGAETNLLRGARRLLAKRHAIILLSVHSRDLRAECLTLLREEEYRSFKPLEEPDIEHASELVISQRK
jgi:FkbM family methyltransferase